MKKLYDLYGEYIPGFFKISINKELHEGIAWNDFNEEEKATLVHEYIHFLQDISTTRGINNFLYVANILQLNFAKAYEMKDCIDLPIDLEKCGNDDAYKESELQSFYMGHDSHFRFHHINKILRQQEEIINEIVDNNEERMYVINIYYDDKDCPYMFGNTAIAESMAYLIETTKYGGMKRKNEFPYNACEIVCQEICPSILKNVDIMVAACELSMMHYHSGDMFWHILKEINENNLKFNCVKDFEKYFFKRTYFLYENMSENFEEINPKLEFMFPAEVPLLSNTGKKFFSLIKKGYNARKQNKLFISKIMEDNFSDAILRLISCFGIPIICDKNYNIFLGDNDYKYMLGPLALYNFFVSRCENQCHLAQFCNKQGVAVYDEKVCNESPWNQADANELCLFGMYWHLYSLEGKSVKRDC
ncbi:MAG: hypothetical protein II992_04410 [Lachnospiraceae bacterium]|nr:hypothetical protein [Lachnospiraceae bacterium]MBQ4530490.1 hypothetical protein [Lachnospiraceae bacterium]